MKTSSLINFIYSCSAPAIASIDSYIKKDVLNLLGKVTQIAPVELGADSKVSFSYGYFFFYSSTLSRSFEWENINYDARAIQAVIAAHPRAKNISGLFPNWFIFSSGWGRQALQWFASSGVWGTFQFVDGRWLFSLPGFSDRIHPSFSSNFGGIYFSLLLTSAGTSQRESGIICASIADYIII